VHGSAVEGRGSAAGVRGLPQAPGQASGSETYLKGPGGFKGERKVEWLFARLKSPLEDSPDLWEAWLSAGVLEGPLWGVSGKN